MVKQSVLINSGSTLTQKIDYSGGSAPIYIGEAQPGTAVATAKWRIKKLTYSGSNVTDVQWASGTSNFDKVWNNRATYTYS